VNKHNNKLDQSHLRFEIYNCFAFLHFVCFSFSSRKRACFKALFENIDRNDLEAGFVLERLLPTVFHSASSLTNAAAKISKKHFTTKNPVRHAFQRCI